MAIVKLKYISKFNPKKQALARAHVRYLVHRKGQNGEKMDRRIFNYDGQVLYIDALKLIENLQTNQHIFKIIINFDPKREDAKKDLNLERITRVALLRLQELMQKDFEYIAVMHNDHGNKHEGKPLRHIHAMVFASARIGVREIQLLRAYTTQLARDQRRTLDLVQEQFRSQLQSYNSTRPIRFYRPEPYKSHVVHVRPLKSFSCHKCEYNYTGFKRFNKCPACGADLSRNRGLELSLEL